MAITISGSLTISGSFTSGTDIITDELVLYIDAANKRSYPGSGTTVYNLANRNVTATLVNGTAFNTGQKGHFDLDGTNDYIDFGDNDIYTFGDSSDDSAFSVSAWIYLTCPDSFTILNKFLNYAGEWQFYVADDEKLYWVIYDDSVGAYGAYQYIYTGTITSFEGQWLNVVGTYDGRAGNSARNGLKIYINGVVQSTTTAIYATYVAMENTNLPLRSGRVGTYYTEGKIATLQINKKELSAAEVYHNYLALLPRFT